jgi:GNAT superfamily N-acetyltransferase
LSEIIYYTAIPFEHENLLKECAELYSAHYGQWGNGHENYGDKIKLSASRLSSWIPNEQTAIYTARDGERLIGYAIALRENLKNHGIVSWVTQFVVHTDYRHRGIGSNLLRHIWGMTNDYAWGIVTSNPYAIRALEKSTRRRSDPKIICKDKRCDKLLDFGQLYVGNYIKKDIERTINKNSSQINTGFNVDHSTIQERINSLCQNGIKWEMGQLNSAWEWFAFTFQSQAPFDLSQEEIKEILLNTDNYAKEAYKRMLGGNGSTDENKPYAKYTNREVEFIITECRLQNNSLLYDFGCGNGRHSICLASHNYYVKSIDYVEENINVAKNKILDCYEPFADFCVGDCRDYKFTKKADAIICLYDVIGSFSREEDNEKIILNI